VHTITEGKKSFSRGIECFGNSLLLHAPKELSGKHVAHDDSSEKNAPHRNGHPQFSTRMALASIRCHNQTERGGKSFSLMNANIPGVGIMESKPSSSIIIGSRRDREWRPQPHTPTLRGLLAHMLQPGDDRDYCRLANASLSIALSIMIILALPHDGISLLLRPGSRSGPLPPPPHVTHEVRILLVAFIFKNLKEARRAVSALRKPRANPSNDCWHRRMWRCIPRQGTCLGSHSHSSSRSRKAPG
jgi:hypothetical protein